MPPSPPSKPALTAAIALSATLVLAPRAARAQSAGGETTAGGASNEAQAQARFLRGRELYLRHEWAGALDEFRAANALYASPNTRLYIARCLRETGQFAAAYVEFERAAAEASDRAAREPRYGPTRDNARSEGAAVRAHTAMLTLHVANAPDGLDVAVNGQPVQRAGWDVATPYDPGEVTVDAHAPGRAPFHQSVTLTAGQSADVAIELAPAPSAPVEPTTAPVTAPPVEPTTTPTPTHDEEHSTPSPGGGLGGVQVAGLVIGGIGLVGLGLFAGFGVAANGDFGALSMQCQRLPCDDPTVVPTIEDGERSQAIANVGLGVGIVGVATGAIMLAAGAGQGRPAAHASASGWTVWASGAGPVLAGVRGAF